MCYVRAQKNAILSFKKRLFFAVKKCAYFCQKLLMSNKKKLSVILHRFGTFLVVNAFMVVNAFVVFNNFTVMNGFMVTSL